MGQEFRQYTGRQRRGGRTAVRQLLILERLETRDLPSFAAPPAYLAGNSPSDVVSDDFNGDGLYDLAVSNDTSPGAVTVLLNQGGGKFGPLHGFPTGGAYASAVAAADETGDGQLDLVVANFSAGSYNHGSIAVLRGSGTGLFRRPVSANLDIPPTALTLGDFNGDGVPDAAVINHDDGQIRVLLNNGAGSFQQSFADDFGGKPNALAEGDFNGDGRDDLVVVGYFKTGKTLVYLSNGNGTFSVSAAYFDGAPSTVTLGDYDGDGVLDLAVADGATGGSSVSVHLGHGDGTFQLAGSYPAGASLGAVDTEDVNRDGHLDVIALNPATARFTVLFGHGDGTFEASPAYPAGVKPAAVAVRDYTGDGVPDVAVANAITPPNQDYSAVGTVTLQAGLGGGTFTAPLRSFGGAYQAWDMLATDLNGDSDPDLVVTSRGNPGYASVFVGAAGAGFQPVVHYQTHDDAQGVASADFTHDGAPDVAVATRFNSLFQVALGNGDGTLGSFASYPGANGYGIAANDFNGDGNADVAVVDDGGNVYLYLGLGNGTFQPAGVSTSVGYAIDMIATDFNGNGKLDLAVVSPGGYGNGYASRIGVLLGNGDGTFQPVTVVAPGKVYSWAPVAADFDGDGTMDLGVVNRGTPFLGVGSVGTMAVYRGNGDGTFQPPVTYAVGSAPWSITAGDFNGDGAADLAVANESGGTVSVLLNNGAGAFQAFHYSVGIGPVTIAAADVNQDGHTDLAFAGPGYVSLLVNDGAWPPAPGGGGRQAGLRLPTASDAAPALGPIAAVRIPPPAVPGFDRQTEAPAPALARPASLLRPRHDPRALAHRTSAGSSDWLGEADSLGRT
jgi:hypothetical protein